MLDDNHTHCPYGCEHPQPFEQDGKEYCCACWVHDHELVEMVKCGPDICD